MCDNPPYTTLKGAQVLVTGATGFIGQHLCAALNGHGAHVLALRRASSSIRPSILQQDTVEWVEADLRNRADVERTIQPLGATHIFNLAALTSGDRGLGSADEMLVSNLHGTIHLLQALEGTDYKRFIQAGSAEEYGAAPSPTREDAPLSPVSAYSATKAAASLFCDMLSRTRGYPIVILRPFLAYGPGQTPERLIPQAIIAGLKDQPFRMTSGRQTREFTYVDDIVDGFIRAAVTPAAIGHTINLGTGDPVSVSYIVSLVMELTGASNAPLMGAIPDRPGEIWSYVCDNSKARKLLGWAPVTSLSDGLTMTIEWYKDALAKKRIPSLDRLVRCPS
ncbi:MAG: NAD-dependent epimerase/dehydratase family protein [Gammaproteobacteria bacterium]|nr:NAD-dependent epimerase/dehydratase family protein [Gammaproteobacteria bacterium]